MYTTWTIRCSSLLGTRASEGSGGCLVASVAGEAGAWLASLVRGARSQMKCRHCAFPSVAFYRDSPDCMSVSVCKGHFQGQDSAPWLREGAL